MKDEDAVFHLIHPNSDEVYNWCLDIRRIRREKYDLAKSERIVNSWLNMNLFVADVGRHTIPLMLEPCVGHQAVPF